MLARKNYAHYLKQQRHLVLKDIRGGEMKTSRSDKPSQKDVPRQQGCEAYKALSPVSVYGCACGRRSTVERTITSYRITIAQSRLSFQYDLAGRKAYQNVADKMPYALKHIRHANGAFPVHLTRCPT